MMSHRMTKLSCSSWMCWISCMDPTSRAHFMPGIVCISRHTRLYTSTPWHNAHLHRPSLKQLFQTGSHTFPNRACSNRRGIRGFDSSLKLSERVHMWIDWLAGIWGGGGWGLSIHAWYRSWACHVKVREQTCVQNVTDVRLLCLHGMLLKVTRSGCLTPCKFRVSVSMGTKFSKQTQITSATIRVRESSWQSTGVIQCFCFQNQINLSGIFHPVYIFSKYN